ncbi:MAG: class C sortase [Clostridia bacterium]|nr:class C sortase [Clostridia bacterium]
MAKKKGKTKAQKLNILIYLIAGLMLLAGVGIFSYPAVSNYLQEKNHTAAIEVYDEAANEKSQEEIDKEFQKAKVYNENLAGDPVHDPFVPGSGYTLPKNYNNVLNINGDGMMGYIEIPAISVKLPIYHSTTEEVLKKGVGHIESTSLPVGGAGTHCVLTGHTGLPSAELFTRLTELQNGDEFYIHILDKTLAYKVCDINVVLPDELENLVAEKGKDYVTLVTCTPYGKNTHRLLVKGERTEYKQDEAKQRTSKKVFGGKYHYYIIGILIALGILVLIGIIIFAVRRKKRKNKDEIKE